MKRNRITEEMSTSDAITVMCEGNTGAIACVAQMINEDPFIGFLDLVLLDILGIYGSKIDMLWNDSCECNMEKFKKTLQIFREGNFSEEEIHKNLSQVRAKPFI